MSWNTRTPSASTPAGSSVCGPMTRTSGAPSVVRPWISERATRECSTSPTIATVRPREILLVVADGVQVEQPLRRVRMAAVAGVDHVLVRLDVARDQVRRAARSRGARRRCRPASPRGWPPCRAATRPWTVEDTAMLRLMTSAERRLAAISKVVRVRVEGSKNRLNTLLPRSSGTFFTSRSVTPTKDSAVSRICTQDLARQPLDGQQVLQLAVGVELRVTLHGRAPARARACRRRRA